MCSCIIRIVQHCSICMLFLLPSTFLNTGMEPTTVPQTDPTGVARRCKFVILTSGRIPRKETASAGPPGSRNPKCLAPDAPSPRRINYNINRCSSCAAAGTSQPRDPPRHRTRASIPSPRVEPFLSASVRGWSASRCLTMHKWPLSRSPAAGVGRTRSAARQTRIAAG